MQVYQPVYSFPTCFGNLTFFLRFILINSFFLLYTIHMHDNSWNYLCILHLIEIHVVWIICSYEQCFYEYSHSLFSSKKITRNKVHRVFSQLVFQNVFHNLEMIWSNCIFLYPVLQTVVIFANRMNVQLCFTVILILIFPISPITLIIFHYIRSPFQFYCLLITSSCPLTIFLFRR